MERDGIIAGYGVRLSDDFEKGLVKAHVLITLVRASGIPARIASVYALGVEPLALWHAITLLREFRGDGHIAALVESGVGPCEALVLQSTYGAIPRATLQQTRKWPDDEWDAAVDALRSRGWLDATGGAARRR